MTSDDRHQRMEAARVRAGLTVQQLWLQYVAMGGTSDAFDVDGYLQGLVPLDTFQQDVLAQTVNEALEDLCRVFRVPLSAAAGETPVDGTLREVVDQLLARKLGAPDLDAGPRGLRPPAAPEE
jgi:hypothetical protein